MDVRRVKLNDRKKGREKEGEQRAQWSCWRRHGCRTWQNYFVIWGKPQALVYDILPSTTAVFSYTIGSRKLSANEQFFVGVQTVVSLLQTTQIISDVCFITDHVAYASSNKTTIVWIETELLFLPGVDASRVYVRALGTRPLPQSY